MLKCLENAHDGVFDPWFKSKQSSDKHAKGSTGSFFRMLVVSKLFLRVLFSFFSDNVFEIALK